MLHDPMKDTHLDSKAPTSPSPISGRTPSSGMATSLFENMVIYSYACAKP